MAAILFIGFELPVAENILGRLLDFHEVHFLFLAAEAVEQGAGLAGRHAAFDFFFALRGLALCGIGGSG
jgi:hypothetical protein